MRKVSLTMLLGIWAAGLLLFALDAALQRGRLRIDAPALRDFGQARRERAIQLRADSALAYANAPFTVTQNGDTVRALAYATPEPVRGRRPLLSSVPVALWLFKVPLLLGAITVIWLVERLRAALASEAPSAHSF